MSGHRVIDTAEGIRGLARGTVLLDADDDIMARFINAWYTPAFVEPFGDYDIPLPARVLIESWERSGLWEDS